MSAEDHVEPAVIQRARSPVYYTSSQNCRSINATRRILTGLGNSDSQHDVRSYSLVS
jgi:hypothetical protein